MIIKKKLKNGGIVEGTIMNKLHFEGRKMKLILIIGLMVLLSGCACRYYDNYPVGYGLQSPDSPINRTADWFFR
jgi:hypothetical protein